MSEAEDRAAEQQAEYDKKIADHDAQVDEWMDADEFVVTAPYVTLRVRDRNGAFVLIGFHEGGRVKRDDIDEASLRHHLDGGMMAPVDSDEAKYAAPAGTPQPGEPPNVPVTEQPVAALNQEDRMANRKAAAEENEAAEARGGRPAAYASKAAWVDYAVTQGADRDDADAKTKADLQAEYGG